MQVNLTKLKSRERVIPLRQQESESEQFTMETETKEMESQQEQPENEDDDVTVLLYNPENLVQHPTEENFHVRTKVFDQVGKEVDISGAGNDILIAPVVSHGVEDGPTTTIDVVFDDITDKENASGSSTSNNNHAKSSTTKSNAMKQEILTNIRNAAPDDQLIITGTALTFALLVGALSARRIRHRQFLSWCIENESLEQDLAFDDAYTTDSTVGAASNLYASGEGYDTFANVMGLSQRYGGDLRWRGDLEKFDV